MMEMDKSVQQMQATGARLMAQTPGLAASMVATAKAQPKFGGARDDRDAMIMDLQRQLDGEKEKNRSLEDQFKYRVASFVKRETQTRNKIESLERRLNDGTDHDEHMQRMGVIQSMHKNVVSSIESIQTNTATILQSQEKDLMRSFRARLHEVTKDLEAHRSKKGEHSTELQARHRRVVAELREAQELAQTFDKKNQQLAAENQKLQEQLSTRADDRQELVKELVLARKENARLKAQVKDEAPEAREEARRPLSQRQVDQARQQASRNQQYEREVQHREACTKLKRMVEAERRTVRALKEQQAELLQGRTELEALLRQCLDDVRAEVARHREEPSEGLSVHELTAQDRERVLELLLSQQRVVQLLYSKTFPQERDELSWLGEAMPEA